MGWCETCRKEVKGNFCFKCERETGPMPEERFDSQRMTDYEESIEQQSADPEVVDSVKTTPELDEIQWPHEEWEADAGLENVKTEEEDVDVEMEDTESMLALQAEAAAEAEAEEYDPKQWEQYEEEEGREEET